MALLETTLAADHEYRTAAADDEAGAQLLKTQCATRAQFVGGGELVNRRRVSELLELGDVGEIERELESLPISTALYAAVMGGVAQVMKVGVAGARAYASGAARKSLELELVREKLAKLEAANAALAYENRALRAAAAVDERTRDRSSVARATFLRAVAGRPPFGLEDPDAVAAWLLAEVAPAATGDEQRARFEAVIEALRKSGADGPALLESCVARTGKAPWFEVRSDRAGRPLDVKLVSLKAFTRALAHRSGLGFYAIVYRSCARLGPLADFAWVRLLGAGSFGSVHLVANRHTGEHRAIKLVHVERTEALERAASEMEYQQIASGSSGVRNSRVAKLYTWGQVEDEFLFAIMEFAAGGELRARIGPDGVGADSFWRWAPQLARGVAELHKRGLLHRDLKPENILLSGASDVLISDLGLARALAGDDGASESMTQAGTVTYMAPELLSGKRANAKADAWSLAVIFFEMYTGRLPDDTAGDALDEYLKGTDDASAFDARAAGFLRFGLKRQPALRPTAADMAVYLRDECAIPDDDEPSSPAPAPAAAPRTSAAEGPASPAPSWRRPAEASDGPAAVVLDPGSECVRCGFAGGERPIILPAVVGRPKFEEKGDVAYVGDEAVDKRGVLNLERPIARGVVRDWDAAERLFLAAFAAIGAAPAGQPIIIAEAPLTPAASRERHADLVFEKLGAPALYVDVAAVLALYGEGHTTGCVLDAGADTTHVVPCVDGYALPHAIASLAVAGRALDERLAAMLGERGRPLASTAEREAVRDVKETLCYVRSENDGAPAEVAYELPDGERLIIGAERTALPEAFFDPESAGFPGPGAPAAIAASIAACDVGVRSDLYRCVLLAGGSCQFGGFADRLRRELEAIAPPTARVHVCAPPDPADSTWRGGALLASLDAFRTMRVSRAAYASEGYAAIHRASRPDTAPAAPPD